MAANFKWSAEAPTAKAAKTPTGKARGSNPPGARTKNEPPRMPYRDALPGVNYRKPNAVAKPDTIELRRAVAQATLDTTDAYDAFLKTLSDFEALGPLPDAIIEDLPLSMRRHLKLYKTHKPQPTKPPFRVLRSFESETRKGTWYEVREDTMGNIYCQCPGYTNRHRCRHIGEALEEDKK